MRYTTVQIKPLGSTSTNRYMLATLRQIQLVPLNNRSPNAKAAKGPQKEGPHNNDFAARATEMKAFFQARGYPEVVLNADLCKISTVSRNEALRPPAKRDSTEGRVPLVLKHNEYNTGTKRILFDNFQMLLSDPATRTIYPELPLVSYRRDRNLRDYLVHSAKRTRCWNVCLPSSSLLNVPTHHISDHFTKPQAPIYHP